MSQNNSDADYDTETLHVEDSPTQGAIGFCPRCEANARDGRSRVALGVFLCGECGYEWYDYRCSGDRRPFVAYFSEANP